MSVVGTYMHSVQALIMVDTKEKGPESMAERVRDKVTKKKKKQNKTIPLDKFCTHDTLCTTLVGVEKNTYHNVAVNGNGKRDANACRSNINSEQTFDRLNTIVLRSYIVCSGFVWRVSCTYVGVMICAKRNHYLGRTFPKKKSDT